VTIASIDRLFIALLSFLVVMLIAGIYLLIAAQIEADRRCKAIGGHYKTYTNTGIGTGISSNGGVVIIPTTTSTSLCLSEDGRILQ
jgi:hypothetical protein